MKASSNITRTASKSRRCLMRASDEQLLLQYRDRGDTEAFDLLWRRYERELFNYLHRYLGDAEQAEDVFQATFIQVHRRSHLFDKERRVRPWLYTIANHQAIDWMRRSRRHQLVSLDVPSAGAKPENSTLGSTLESPALDPALQVEVREERAWARRAVARLPKQLRAALILIYFQGMKYRDAAEVLGVPEGTLKTRVHAAVAILRRSRSTMA